MTKTAFIGLGVMGFPMAGHKAAKGHEVTVYNRTTEKAEEWVNQHGGKYVTTPRDAAAGAEVVCACVGNDNDLRSITYGNDGILAGMKEGAIFVDHTTASADVAREISEKAATEGIVNKVSKQIELLEENVKQNQNLGGNRNRNETNDTWEIIINMETNMGSSKNIG